MSVSGCGERWSHDLCCGLWHIVVSIRLPVNVIEQAWRLCCDCMLLHQAASYRCLGFVGILAVCVPSQISNLVSLIDEGEGGIDLKFFFINWRFYSDISISLLISAKKIMGRLVQRPYFTTKWP